VEPRDRILLIGAGVLVALHLVAAWAAPTALWGLSHLAAAPAWAAGAWTALALAALAGARRLSGRSTRLASFPGWRASALIAIACALPFWLLRERVHLFGDGSLLTRNKGYSETVMRAPVLVRGTYEWVRAAERRSIDAETALAALSVVAGVVAVFALLRMAAALTPDRGGRVLTAALLLTAGTMQLFFGHVEYYAVPAAALALYLWLATAILARDAPAWPTWIAWGVLVPLHLSALALLPAQVFLGVRDARRGRRALAFSAAAAAVALAIAWILPRLAGHKSGALLSTLLAGPKRYLSPFFDTTTSKHAFGFLSPGHGLALVNDLLLLAPVALVALPILWRDRRRRPDAQHVFLGIAALGGLALSVVFHRELGPVRDWDLLAINGFLVLAFVAACLVRPHPGRQRIAIVAVAIAGLHHLVPWVVLQTRPAATVAWIERMLHDETKMSVHARAYWWEELAIHHRQHRDENASLRAYEAAVAANPADARYRVGLGNRYLLRGDAERAILEYRAALARRPGLAAAHNNLASAQARLNRDLPEARAHARRAVAADSNNADYWATLALVEARAGDAPAAGQAVARALRLRPNHRAARAIADALASGRPVAPTTAEAPATAP